VASFTAAVLVVLALPVGALFGRSGDGPASAAGLSAGTVYVVQPGDTLWGIASRVDPSGDPRAVVAQLEGEVGSDVVVPGEHLRLP
jgi:LysM repeat protein